MNPICNTLHFPILNLISKYFPNFDNLFLSTCVISFDNGPTSSLTSANSSVPDFKSLDKSFVNIKSNKGRSTDPCETPQRVHTEFQNNRYQFLLS